MTTTALYPGGYLKLPAWKFDAAAAPADNPFGSPANFYPGVTVPDPGWSTATAKADDAPALPVLHKPGPYPASFDEDGGFAAQDFPPAVYYARSPAGGWGNKNALLRAPRSVLCPREVLAGGTSDVRLQDPDGFFSAQPLADALDAQGAYVSLRQSGYFNGLNPWPAVPVKEYAAGPGGGSPLGYYPTFAPSRFAGGLGLWVFAWAPAYYALSGGDYVKDQASFDAFVSVLNAAAASHKRLRICLPFFDFAGGHTVYGDPAAQAKALAAYANDQSLLPPATPGVEWVFAVMDAIPYPSDDWTPDIMDFVRTSITDFLTGP